uniref:Uncharacterized protein n=1 Tax=Rhizophora mucronata TaxID=61149 RepID=A0A2P2Q7B9_RHIMU
MDIFFKILAASIIPSFHGLLQSSKPLSITQTIIVKNHQMELSHQRNYHSPNSVDHGVLHVHDPIEANPSPHDPNRPHFTRIPLQPCLGLLRSGRLRRYQSCPCFV